MNLVKLQNKLLELYQQQKTNFSGNVATYIPELARSSPENFALAIVTVDGQIISMGNDLVEFSLQSTSKPFVYGYALEKFGRHQVLKKVGVEPSGEAFNSIVELERKSNRPYNPMINSGAIAIAGMIEGSGPLEKLKVIQNLFSQLVGRSIHVDTEIFLSEKMTAHRNRSIAQLLRHFNVIESNIEEILDLYFQQCALMVNVKDLAMMAATLANSGQQPLTHQSIYSAEVVRDILSVMFTCGMYDSSGEWAFEVGLPAKSGVSGGMIAVIPGKMGIAVYSPLIDEKGHSVRGLEVFKALSDEFGLSLFQARSVE